MTDKKRLGIQLLLFLLTVVTTTLAGAELIRNKSLLFGEDTLSWGDFVSGFEYSIPFLFILSAHEFGHYFTARFHHIRTTLPYYIPIWIPISISFGTMGALIRIQDTIWSRRQYFDIGISGPLAGFVVAMGVIWYGFTHLPEPDYIFQVHPEYAQYGLDYASHVYTADQGTFRLGGNLIYTFFVTYVADPARMPHPNEIIHYPWLMVGFLSLFFTALNLLPIGQLDGGHIIFGMFGNRNHRRVSRVLFTLFVFYAGLGVWKWPPIVDLDAELLLTYLAGLLLYGYFLYLCAYSMMKTKSDRWLFAALMLVAQLSVHELTGWTGYSGWLVFALILGRFIGIYHPRVLDNKPLSTNRKILGWIAVVIFILSFSPEPFITDF